MIIKPGVRKFAKTNTEIDIDRARGSSEKPITRPAEQRSP